MLEKPHRVVVVDDDPHVLSALRFAFETDGYEVITWRSGEELLASPPLSSPTCLIVDERLPGVTGLEAIARLRAAGVAAPVFLVTSNPSAALIRRAAAAHVEIVEKPLLGDVLAAKVRAALADEI